MAKKNNEVKAIEELGLVFGEELEQTNEEKFDLPSYKVELKDLDNDDIYTGKPILCPPSTFTFTDKTTGKKETRHNCCLWLVDKDEDEYLEIVINLKNEGMIQENIYPQSKLYPLLKGVMNMKYGVGSDLFDEKKVIDKVNLETVIKWCEEFPKMSIRVEEKTGKFIYNTFHVIKPQ